MVQLLHILEIKSGFQTRKFKAGRQKTCEIKILIMETKWTSSTSQSHIVIMYICDGVLVAYQKLSVIPGDIVLSNP